MTEHTSASLVYLASVASPLRPISVVDVIVLGTYVLGYLVAVIFFRRFVDPRLRAALGKRLGVEIAWGLDNRESGTGAYVNRGWTWVSIPDAGLGISMCVVAVQFVVVAVCLVPSGVLALVVLGLSWFHSAAGIVALFAAALIAVRCLTPPRRFRKR